MKKGLKDMQQVLLDGTWKIRWCDGQRGGMPHFLHTPGEDRNTYLKGLTRSIDETGYDPRVWMEVTVPGEIHTELMKKGIIPSPYTEAGVLQSRWVEECYWFYRKEFDAKDLYMKPMILLRFESLELSAVIFLNGEEIGRHSNAFRPCILDISGKLRPEGNILTVQLESGLFSVSEKNSSDYYSATMTPDILLHKRNWLRKTQSQMAWDWAPRLMNVGLTGSVSIVSSDTILVEEAFMNSSLSPDLKIARLRVRAEVKKAGPDKRSFAVAVEIQGKSYVREYDEIPENNILEISTELTDPVLWWPVGMGEQKIYDVGITILAEDQVVYSTVKHVGFRHVDVDQSPHPDKGNYFVFRINGIPVFMKGANMVPADLITSSVTPERYENLIDLALGANFNFLRVWGGGLYETDVFYELCDRKGILVWQEFISACAVIPAADPYLFNDISAEALYQIRRLAEHPSLIAWCGNNEVGWGCNGRTDMHCGEDNVLYEELFPDLLASEDPDKYYQPTSPYSRNVHDYNDETTGDQHPWSVGFHDKDSRKYETMLCRFANEGGILGPTSLHNMKKCLLPGEGYGSFSWQVHDNMEAFAAPGTSPDSDLLFWTGLCPSELSLQEYVYTGGFIQGEGLKRYIENFRRRKFNSSGAVFWMYNDCWPAVRSWTIVDHSLNRTPSYHSVKRSFAPVVPVVSVENDMINVFAASDLMTDWNGQLRWGAFTVSGKYLIKETIECSVAANSSVRIISSECAAIGFPRRVDGEAVLIYAEIYDNNGKLLSRTRYTSLKFNELGLPSVSVRMTRIPNGLRLESDGYAMGVCVDLSGSRELSDNFFDIYPGQKYEISCPPDFTPEMTMCINDLRLPI